MVQIWRLGNDSSLYWLLLINVPDGELIFSVYEVAIVLVLLTLLQADTLQTLTPFTPGEIWLPDSKTAGLTWLVGWPISLTLIGVLACGEVRTADGVWLAWLLFSIALTSPISEFNFWIYDRSTYLSICMLLLHSSRLDATDLIWRVSSPTLFLFISNLRVFTLASFWDL